VLVVINNDSLMRRRLCDKLHGRPSQLSSSDRSKPAIRPGSGFLPTPAAFDAPVKGVPVGILP